MHIAIIDYQAGNQTSVQRALAHLGHAAEVTADPAVIAASDRIIFPGVGAAGSCMANLREGHLDAALQAAVGSGKPVLGVCIGMQLLFEFSDEDGGVPCLGILDGLVERFTPDDPTVKVPHMGWNAVDHRDDALFAGIPSGERFYFVHSYYCIPHVSIDAIAIADHGGRFCAGVRKGPLAAVQFHPEKSGPAGLRLLDNFVRG